MIRLPLDGFSHVALNDRPDIVVDRDYESGQVELTIEFEPNEMRPFVRRQTPAAAALPAEEQLTDEISALREALERIDRDVTRHLSPDEARALAAMLVHFANEAERPR